MKTIIFAFFLLSNAAWASSELEIKLSQFESKQPQMVKAYKTFRNLASASTQEVDLKKMALKHYFKTLKDFTTRHPEYAQFLTPYLKIETLIDLGKFQEFVVELDKITLITLKNYQS